MRDFAEGVLRLPLLKFYLGYVSLSVLCVLKTKFITHIPFCKFCYPIRFILESQQLREYMESVRLSSCPHRRLSGVCSYVVGLHEHA